MTWEDFCRAPGQALDLLARQERVTIRARDRIDLTLTKNGLASDKPHRLTVGVRELKDGQEKARARVQAAIERGEVVGISRFGWREAMIERMP